MPTISSRRDPVSGQPHRARHAAESFGADPARYHRTRPRYPQALIDQVIGSIPGRDVLDVGIGTGVAADPFRSAGYRVFGIDVDFRMLAFARERGYPAEHAKFENWDPAGRTFDAIIAGMTWHWLDPTAAAVKAARVLRPHGLLALFWNVHQPPDELAQAFGEVYRRVVPDAPYGHVRGDPVDTYGHILTTASAGIDATRAFTHPERLRVDWKRRYTSEEWLDQVPTFGGHSTFAPDQLDALLSGMKTAIDQAGGSFTMRYAALALTARRKAEKA